MASLKGVIFGIGDVLVNEDTKLDDPILAEVARLLSFLSTRGIGLAAIGNHDWTVTNRESGASKSLRDYLKESWGVEIHWFIRNQSGFPTKQSAEALAFVRAKLGWETNETLYVGNSEADMQSAVNGGTLFLNALWFGDNCKYGFRFATPKEVARFIDVFCLRSHWWYFAIEDGDRQVYSLAPYSTYAVADYKKYSENFIETVKKKLGDEEDVAFWAKYLCTSMYFSGLYKEVNYIAPYPSHQKGTTSPSVLAEPMTVFAKCFRKNFIPNLIVRHKNSIESKKNRDSVDHANQLNTIHLNHKPEKSPGTNYKNSPVHGGKTVLILDDILTCGYSFEAARTFIGNTGAKVICVSFLKAMNRNYEGIGKLRLSFPMGPYEAFTCDKVVIQKQYSYSQHTVDAQAASELSSKLDAYSAWDWPKK
jgi:predicted amidophosphoribosyltransferase